MTKNTISDAALEIIHGGTEIVEDGMSSSSSKGQEALMADSSSGSSNGGSIDTAEINQNSPFGG